MAEGLCERECSVRRLLAFALLLTMLGAMVGPCLAFRAVDEGGGDDAARARFWIEQGQWARAIPFLERLVVDGKASPEILWERARCRQELGLWARGLLDWEEFLRAKVSERPPLFEGEGPPPVGYRVEASKVRLWWKPETSRLLIRQHLQLKTDEHGRRVFRFFLGEKTRLRRVRSRDRELVHARKGTNLAVEFPWVAGDGRYDCTLEGELALGSEELGPRILGQAELGLAGETCRKGPLDLVLGAPGGWELVASGACEGRRPTEGGSAAHFILPPDRPWTVALGRWSARTRPGPFGAVEVYLLGEAGAEADGLAEGADGLLRYFARHFGELDLGAIRILETHGEDPTRGGLLPIPSPLLRAGMTTRDLAMRLARLWWPDRDEENESDRRMLAAIRSYVAHLADGASNPSIPFDSRVERIRQRLYDTGGEGPPPEGRETLALHRMRGQLGKGKFKSFLLAMRAPEAHVDKEGLASIGRKLLGQWKGYVLDGRDVDLCLGKVQGYRLPGRGQDLSDPQGALHRYVSEIRLRNRGTLSYAGPVTLKLRTLRRSYTRKVELRSERGTYHFTTAQPLVEVAIDPEGWLVERDRENNARSLSPRLKTWRDWQELQG